MPSHSKSKKRKSKTKSSSGNGKKAENDVSRVTMAAELYNDDEQYPTSRVIKRAPNGDIIVESIPSNESSSKSNIMQKNSPMAFALDSHWEWLSADEKKDILRIERDEVFEILSKYNNKNNHHSTGSGPTTVGSNGSGCTCNVCGRRHVAMDQEMERIYNRLYELHKDHYEDMNHIKFHLSIIKELQIPKLQIPTSPISPMSPVLTHSSTASDDNTESSADNEVGPIVMEDLLSRKEEEFKTDIGNMKDSVLNYALSSNSVDSLKKEVLNFKQSKTQQKQFQPPHIDEKMGENIPASYKNEQISPKYNGIEENITSSQEDKMKYLDFAKTFVSSHPTIAQEYVNKMMMFPEMKELTDDLMNNNGSGFVKAIESFVMQKEQDHQNDEVKDSTELLDIDIANYHDAGDAKEFTTMLHNGKPLTPEEYANLQRHIAERVTNSYDTDKREFKGISQLEKELFTRFMYGSERRQFGDLILQSFKDKYDDEFSTTSIGASLAAAASAVSSSRDFSLLQENDNDDTDEDVDYYDSEHDHDDLDNENDQNYEYSDYDESEYNPSSINDNNVDKDMSYYDIKTGDDVECAHPEHRHGESLTYDKEPYTRTTSHDGAQNNNENYSDFHHNEEYTDEQDDEYDSGIDETERLDEGRKLLQIAITKILQGRIMESYHEKQAEKNRLKLLEELEAEESKKKEKKEKKQKKKEKEKEKKRMQQVAKEEEKKKKEEEAVRIKKEAEERELERREAQRKKVEEAKRKKDEERKRKLEEQRRREDEQERQRKAKEEIKRKRDEERRQKEEENKQKEEEQRKLKEERKQQQQQELLEKQRLEAEMLKRLQHDEILKSQAAASAALQVPYCSLLNAIPMVEQNPSSINDDIFGMINAATASKSISGSPSNLNKLLQPSNQVPFDVNTSKQFLQQPRELSFGQNDLSDATSFSNKNNSFDTLAALNGSQVQSSMNFGTNSLNSQSFDNYPWGTFPDATTTDQHQLAPHVSQQSRLGSLSMNADINRKSFNNELNNISSILSSASLNDHVPNKDSFGSSSLWGSQGTPLSSSNTNLASNLISSGIPPTQSQISPQSAPIGTATHRSSIWGTSNTGEYSINDPNIVNERQSDVPVNNANIPSNYTPGSIWSQSTPNTMNFMEQNIGFPSIEGQNGIADNIIIRELAQLTIRSPTDLYITNDLLYQKVMLQGIDYTLYINEIFKLRNIGKCELLSNEAGQLTHVKLLNTNIERDLQNSNHNSMSVPLMNHNNFVGNPPTNNAGGIPTPASNVSIPTTTTNANLVNSQFYNMNQPAGNSSLIGNIWS